MDLVESLAHVFGTSRICQVGNSDLANPPIVQNFHEVNRFGRRKSAVTGRRICQVVDGFASAENMGERFDQDQLLPVLLRLSWGMAWA